MGRKRNELLTGSAAFGAASIGALLIDPTGMGGFLTGILGSTAFEGIRKLKRGLNWLVPREVCAPEHPLNQALARAATKALHFAAGQNALLEFQKNAFVVEPYPF